MRLLFLGDVMGRSGRDAVSERLPGIIADYKFDFVVINGENAAGGIGITERICDDLLGAGADVVTLGNHAFDQREAMVFIERQPRLIRPANFSAGTPGRSTAMIETSGGRRVLVEAGQRCRAWHVTVHAVTHGAPGPVRRPAADRTRRGSWGAPGTG